MHSIESKAHSKIASKGPQWSIALITLATICSILFISPALASSADKEWFTSFEEAQAEAKVANRPLLVRFPVLSGTSFVVS